jgi:cyclopropane-fatty-acyl-phospholipid synthase
MTDSLTQVRAPGFAPDRKSNLALYDLLATGMVPEILIRWGIRAMLAWKLVEHRCDDPELNREKTSCFVEALKRMPIALSVDAANQQHYEVPSEFFQHILGPAMKYSCCLWSEGSDLALAELDMLALTAARAEIADEQQILDLGCGWGSAQQAKRWWIYWRIFLLSCAELWGFDSGRQWIVSHYLFSKR